MNGVCVKWIGWVDLETLTGKAKLVFDDQNAKVCMYTYMYIGDHILIEYIMVLMLSGVREGGGLYKRKGT